MGRNLNPKCKQCRRIGEKLFLKGDRCLTPKCGVVKRNFPPGMHGAKGVKGKTSNYGLQLKEKQKAKKEYNILEKQFKLTYEKGKNLKGDAGENLFRLLETRLDNVVFRLGFASSRSQARAMVSHCHFLVNDQKVNIPSYTLKAGDVVKLKERSKKLKIFNTLTEKLKNADVPSWLSLNAKDLSGKVLNAPALSEIKMNINPQIIIEFYSR